MLDARAGDTHRIDFLERIGTDHRGRHLPGQDHHRDGIHVGRGDTGHGIGRTGTGGDQHHTDLAGRARIAIGGMGGGLLVAHQDVTHLFLLEDGVIDMQHGAARVTPDVLHAFVFQCLNDDFGTTEFHLDDLQNLE